MMSPSPFYGRLRLLVVYYPYESPPGISVPGKPHKLFIYTELPFVYPLPLHKFHDPGLANESFDLIAIMHEIGALLNFFGRLSGSSSVV